MSGFAFFVDFPSESFEADSADAFWETGVESPSRAIAMAAWGSSKSFAPCPMAYMHNGYQPSLHIWH